ncbi:MAG: glycine cleavage system protein GcvH [Rhodospirillaceae bacterium]|nr:glycine cleavage system protein GcvH [Rhodospirillaceae bacterium]
MTALRFTEDHEWISVDGTSATVGITDYAQDKLGDIVFVELPEVGRVVEKGEAVCVVESVKAASDVYAVASGTVTEVNTALEGEPALVNNAAETDGWFYKMELSNPEEVAALMDEAAYQALVDGAEA